jgi:hypothetical protein
MYHSFEFIKFIGEKYLNPDNIRFHTVTQPFYFAPGICKGDMKKELIEFYETNIQTVNSNAKHSLIEFVKYLRITDNDEVYEHLLDKKKYLKISLPETLRRFDEINETDYREICPWLGEIFID